MSQSSTHSVKNAERYFKQFVKIFLPKNSGRNQVKNLPSSAQSLHFAQIQTQFLQQQWKWQLQKFLSEKMKKKIFQNYGIFINMYRFELSPYFLD